MGSFIIQGYTPVSNNDSRSPGYYPCHHNQKTYKQDPLSLDPVLNEHFEDGAVDCENDQKGNDEADDLFSKHFTVKVEVDTAVIVRLVYDLRGGVSGKLSCRMNCRKELQQ